MLCECVYSVGVVLDIIYIVVDCNANSSSLSWSEAVQSILVFPTKLHAEGSRVTPHAELHTGATAVTDSDPVLSDYTVHQYLVM